MNSKTNSSHNNNFKDEDSTPMGCSTLSTAK